MTTAFNLRKLLHRKSWEMCTIAPSVTASDSFVVSDKYNIIPNSFANMVTAAGNIYRYDGDHDAWFQLPASGVADTFGPQSCGGIRGIVAMGGTFTQDVTGGTTTTIITNKTIVRNLVNRRLRVIAGTGSGYDQLITSNTIGANSVLPMPANTVAFDATTKFQVYSSSLWLFNAGTSVVGFSLYDLATNTWTARAVTNYPQPLVQRASLSQQWEPPDH